MPTSRLAAMARSKVSDISLSISPYKLHFFPFLMFSHAVRTATFLTLQVLSSYLDANGGDNLLIGEDNLWLIEQKF